MADPRVILLLVVSCVAFLQEAEGNESSAASEALNLQLETSGNGSIPRNESLRDQLIRESGDSASLVTLGDGKYFFSNQLEKSWHDAKIFCENLGLHLVSIESTEENQLILDRKTELGMSDTWIGGTDEAVEDTWRWIGKNQTLTYANWRSGQPDGEGDQNCMDFWNDGEWHDFICSIEEPFICEL